MFDAEGVIRGDLREMAPYQPIHPFKVLSEELGIPRNELVKLDANENPYGPPPGVRRALENLTDVHIYPDPESRALRSALAGHHDLPIEQLMAGAGADELIDLTMRLLIEPHDAVLTCPPTFGMYEFDGALNGAQVLQVPRKSDLSLDLESVVDIIARERPKLALLAHPNNPDGSLVGKEAVEELLSLPTIVLLDEAYVEFADPGSSWLAEVPERSNLIVLRTFSKWAGLAGLRIGYGAFPRSLVPHLWKIKQPYNVSVAASAAALAALKEVDVLNQVADRIRRERNRLLELLAEHPSLEPYPSQANFVFCRVLGGAERLTNELRAQGVLVRHFNKPRLEDHIRISVGRPADTDKLMSTLRTWE